MILNLWQQQGEWTVRIVDENAEVVARSAPEIVAAVSGPNSNWELTIDAGQSFLPGLPLESTDRLGRITLKSTNGLNDAMLRLVHVDAY